MHPFLFLYLGIIASVLLDNRVYLLDYHLSPNPHRPAYRYSP